MIRVLIGFVLIMLSSVVVAWPTKNITIVVPYPVGGAVDILARSLVFDISSNLKDSIVVVKNLPGAANVTAINSILSSDNDNHTILLTSEEMVTSSVLMNNNYHNEFIPINIIATSPYIFFTGKKNFSIEIFLEENKKGKDVSIATGGPYSNIQLWSRTFGSNLKLTTIQFKGFADISQAILGEHVDYAGVSLTGFKQISTNKNITPIMVLSEKRIPQYPKLPTYLELGFSGPPAPLVWYGIFVRKDTNTKVVQTLTDVFFKTIPLNPKLKNDELDVINLSGSKAVQFIQKEIQKAEKFKK